MGPGVPPFDPVPAPAPIVDDLPPPVGSPVPGLAPPPGVVTVTVGPDRATTARRRILIGLLAVVVLVTAGAIVWSTWSSEDGAGDEWVEIVTASGAYTVSLPGESTQRDESIVLSGQPLLVDVRTIGGSELERVRDGVVLLELDLSGAPAIAGVLSNPDLGPQVVSTQARGVVAGAGVRVESVTPVESSLGTAVDVAGSGPEPGLVVRGHLVADRSGRVLGVLVAGTDVATVEARFDRIVASIRPT